jgi:16S rRNA (guanine527-N7)-methyltransferase
VAPTARTIGERIEELVSRHQLSGTAEAQLEALLSFVVADARAPTTVKDPEGIVDDHLADSLVALELDAVRRATAVSDLGAGAGFPGLPLAIAMPAARVRLVESNGRKCEFIARAIAACGLDNADAIHARAEAWPEGIASSDLVTARALAAPDVVAEYAAPLLRRGGSLVIWRGQREREAEAAAERAAAQLGLQVQEPIRVTPYPGAEHRYLHVMSKVRETPPRFPRRPGMAQKRPLGRIAASSDRAQR